jgi:hypothetical protein
VCQAMDAQTARDPAERAVEILQTEGMSKSDATLAVIDAAHNHCLSDVADLPSWWTGD